jgi:nucleoside phosphorylase
MSMAETHTHRQEIARYLLSRGTRATAGDGGARAAHAPPRALKKPIPFPSGLAPVPATAPPDRASSDPLPRADVVVITWTVDEVAALAGVLTPGVSPEIPKSKRTSKPHWVPYDHNFADFAPQIRGTAPAQHAKRLGSFYPLTIGKRSVLAMKSELHLNQDGIKTGAGTATLPVKDFFKQIIAEAKPKVVITAGTAGSVFPSFGLGDVVVTRAAQFMCTEEFAAEPFNHQTYKSSWTIPPKYLSAAEQLMQGFAAELSEPPVGPPSPEYPPQADLSAPGPVHPHLRLDDGHAMDAFHPILTTDYFEYGTTENRLEELGAAVEMGDAALGLACAELVKAKQKAPHWVVVRNMSDPVINGALPKKQFHLNEQTTWAVAFYTAYGKYTSIMSSLAAWAIVAGL